MSRTILADVNGFTPLIDDLARRHGITVAAVFGRVWRYCNGSDQICRASQQTIADELGINRDTVNHALKVLVNDGYLKDLTPGLVNRPHIYQDTGYAGIKVRFTAGNSDTEHTETQSTVGNSDTTAEISDTILSEIPTPAAGNSDKKKESIKELKKEINRFDASSPNGSLAKACSSWKMFLSFQRDVIPPPVFKKLATVTVEDFHAGVLTLRAPPEELEYLRQRLSNDIQRQLTGPLGEFSLVWTATNGNDETHRKE